MVRFVHKRQLGKASQLCLALANDGMELPGVDVDESAVVERATAVIKHKRLGLSCLQRTLATRLQCKDIRDGRALAIARDVACTTFLGETARLPSSGRVTGTTYHRVVPPARSL